MFDLKSISTLILNLIASRVRLVSKFQTKAPPQELEKQKIFAMPCITFGTCGFCTLDVSWTTLPSFWFHIVSHFGSIWAPFSFEFAFQNRPQVLMRFWLPFYSSFHMSSYMLSPLWLQRSSEIAIIRAPKNVHRPRNRIKMVATASKSFVFFCCTVTENTAAWRLQYLLGLFVQIRFSMAFQRLLMRALRWQLPDITVFSFTHSPASCGSLSTSLIDGGRSGFLRSSTFQTSRPRSNGEAQACHLQKRGWAENATIPKTATKT